MAQEFTVLDIPCGCGGAALGIKQAGFNIVFSLDISEVAAKTYEHNGLGKVIVEDIDKISNEIIPIVDFAWFSFPCQPFSHINAKKSKEDDWRTTYLYNVLQLVSLSKPKIFIFENVPPVIKFKDYRKLKLLLQQLGYRLKEQILNAADFGLPQKRKRLFMVGTIDSLNYQFPEPTHTENFGQTTLKGELLSKWIPVKTILENIPDSQEAVIKCLNFTERHGPREYSINEPLITLTTQNNLELQFLSEKALEGINRRLQQNKENNYGFGCYPINLGEPTDTLTTRYGSLGTDQLLYYSEDRVRKLTIRECARLQGFPDSFEFPFGSKTDKYRLIGNAVPVNVAFALAKSAIFCLQGAEQKA